VSQIDRGTATPVPFGLFWDIDQGISKLQLRFDVIFAKFRIVFTQSSLADLDEQKNGRNDKAES